MQYNVIHIVSSLDSMNLGIWNAAIFGSDYLKEKYQVNSFLFVCTEQRENLSFALAPVWLGKKISEKTLLNCLRQKGLTNFNSIIVTHGAWLKPTRLGFLLKNKGFKWIYAPHGMLEKWGMKQGYWKKKIYFSLFEKSYVEKADRIRAVSEKERNNLVGIFNRSVSLVENGVKLPLEVRKDETEIIYLFMARLHVKKGILPLVSAWCSIMSQYANQKLIIAGPDEGEFRKIEPFFGGNVQYVGAVYGHEKQILLQKAHYFVLPSFSEGFPTSVLEAMSFGAIPVISEGCNFEIVFREKLGYEVRPEMKSIERVLEQLRASPFSQVLSMRNRNFIRGSYDEPSIGEKLFQLYQSLMSIPSAIHS